MVCCKLTLSFLPERDSKRVSQENPAIVPEGASPPLTKMYRGISPFYT
jgi:hypothetical protein